MMGKIPASGRERAKIVPIPEASVAMGSGSENNEFSFLKIFKKYLCSFILKIKILSSLSPGLYDYNVIFTKTT